MDRSWAGWEENRNGNEWEIRFFAPFENQFPQFNGNQFSIETETKRQT